MKLRTVQKISKWVKIHDGILKKYWTRNSKANALLVKIEDYLEELVKKI